MGLSPLQMQREFFFKLFYVQHLTTKLLIVKHKNSVSLLTFQKQKKRAGGGGFFFCLVFF
jgi:hypothetical protein